MWTQWGPEGVGEWLRRLGAPSNVVAAFVEEKVDGPTLSAFTNEDDIKQLIPKDAALRKHIFHSIQELVKPQGVQNGQVFHDVEIEKFTSPLSSKSDLSPESNNSSPKSTKSHPFSPKNFPGDGAELGGMMVQHLSPKTALSSQENEIYNSAYDDELMQQQQQPEAAAGTANQINKHSRTKSYEVDEYSFSETEGPGGPNNRITTTSDGTVRETLMHGSPSFGSRQAISPPPDMKDEIVDENVKTKTAADAVDTNNSNPLFITRPSVHRDEMESAIAKEYHNIESLNSDGKIRMVSSADEDTEKSPEIGELLIAEENELSFDGKVVPKGSYGQSQKVMNALGINKPSTTTTSSSNKNPTSGFTTTTSSSSRKPNPFLPTSDEDDSKSASTDKQALTSTRSRTPPNVDSNNYVAMNYQTGYSPASSSSSRRGSNRLVGKTNPQIVVNTVSSPDSVNSQQEQYAYPNIPKGRPSVGSPRPAEDPGFNITSSASPQENLSTISFDENSSIQSMSTTQLQLQVDQLSEQEMQKEIPVLLQQLQEWRKSVKKGGKKHFAALKKVQMYAKALDNAMGGAGTGGAAGGGKKRNSNNYPSTSNKSDLISKLRGPAWSGLVEQERSNEEARVEFYRMQHTERTEYHELIEKCKTTESAMGNDLIAYRAFLDSLEKAFEKDLAIKSTYSKGRILPTAALLGTGGKKRRKKSGVEDESSAGRDKEGNKTTSASSSKSKVRAAKAKRKMEQSSFLTNPQYHEDKELVDQRAEIIAYLDGMRQLNAEMEIYEGKLGRREGCISDYVRRDELGKELQNRLPDPGSTGMSQTERDMLNEQLHASSAELAELVHLVLQMEKQEEAAAQENASEAEYIRGMWDQIQAFVQSRSSLNSGTTSTTFGESNNLPSSTASNDRTTTTSCQTELSAFAKPVVRRPQTGAAVKQLPPTTPTTPVVPGLSARPLSSRGTPNGGHYPPNSARGSRNSRESYGGGHNNGGGPGVAGSSRMAGGGNASQRTRTRSLDPPRTRSRGLVPAPF
ncbi:unnamed protein product [Amoebophrya sp. A120]|nr:unnamed protein product [Amoebophrya sp. A120]|eukprot:GSA120T00007508001.1